MIRSLSLAILSFALLVNAGCCYEQLGYSGSATYLWLPGIGEWKIQESMPSESSRESLDREDEAASIAGRFAD